MDARSTRFVRVSLLDRPVLGLHGRSQLQEAGRARAFRVQRCISGTGRHAGCGRHVTFGDEKWWDAFQDDALRDLIRAALQQNYDVRIAAARILEARALLGITRADQWPGINAAASVTNERSPQVAGRPPVETSPAQVSVLTRMGAGFLGQVPTRHRVCSRQPSVRRVGATSNHQFARQRCGERLFPVARTGSRTGDLAPDARVPERLAAVDTNPCGPRRHVHAGRAAGRTTRLRRRGLDSRSRTADRTAGKLHQHSRRKESREHRSRPPARRPATPAGSSRGAAVVPARTPPGYRAGGAAAGRGERTNRRGQGGLFPANLVDSRSADIKAQRSPGCSQVRQGCGPSASARCNRSSKEGGFETASGLPKLARKR